MAAALVAGCGDFWESPNGSSSSFTLSNGGNISMGQGTTGSSLITVTPGSSFTGTVTLSCAITTAPSSATDPTTCGLSSSSLTFSSATAQTSTLTATTLADTTLGAYDITVTGVSGSVAATTVVCDEVTTSSGTCSAAPTNSGYFYLLDQTTSQVVAYSISSGTLTEVSAYTLPAAGALAIAVAPNDDFLYVSTGSGIFLYKISSGALTLENSGGSISQDPATAMAVDATDSWLVEAFGEGSLNAIPISSSTGEVNGSCSNCHVPLTGASINQLAISPNNDYVFAAAGANGTYAFTFNAANGSDPFGSAYYAYIPVVNSSNGSALSLAVDPSNRLLYIGEVDASSGSGGLRAYTIGSGGALTALNGGTPYPSGGTGPYAILPISTGDYVYVANWNGISSGNITGFSITGSDPDYSLTNTNNPATTVVEPMGLVEDSTDQFVLAAGQYGSGPYLDAYYFDTTTAGQLDLTISSSAFAASGIAAQH